MTIAILTKLARAMQWPLQRRDLAMINHTYIALGANLAPQFAGLVHALRWGVASLRAEPALTIVAVSSLYATAPVGGAGRQPTYMNAVISVDSRLAPGQLLRLLKRIERKAGRRPRGVNAPRPLDLDIVDSGGRRLGWPTRALRTDRQTRRNPRAWITLPHPEMHRRLFVLQPLAELAPGWHHSVYRMPIRRLLQRLQGSPEQIRRVLDSRWLSCDIVR